MEKVKSDTLDRLSELPESLILEILSLLEMRDVVRTSLLSKRWKYLWTTVPSLLFYENGKNVDQIRNFVSKALTLWTGTYLRKFSISFYSGSDVIKVASLSSDIDLWVLFATERKVEELCITLFMVPFYCPPQSLYNCSSIRSLLLFGCDLQVPAGNVNWDRLNKLKLDVCIFSEDVINQVASSSSQLETLKVKCCDGFQNLSIRSSSMKKLSIICSSYGDTASRLTIWAPNLKVLKISENSFSTYMLTDVSSLTEAYLDLEGKSSAVVGEALCQILPAIQNVATVKLSVSCFEMLGDGKGKYSLSPLLNVKLLRIDSGLLQLNKLDGVLEFFPKLKVLIIDCKVDAMEPDIQSEFKAENYIESEANILNSNLLQLRTIVITWYVYKASFFDFIEFLLKHAIMIERIVMRKGKYDCEADDAKDKFDSEVDDAEDKFDCEVDDLKHMYLTAQKVASLRESFPSVELILC